MRPRLKSVLNTSKLTRCLVSTITIAAFCLTSASEDESNVDFESLSTSEAVKIARQQLLEETPYSAELMKKALRITEKYLVVDTHIDAPIRQYYEARDLTKIQPDVEFDIPRALAGGLDLSFMSIYTSPTAAETGESKEIAEFEIEFVENLVQKVPKHAAIATCAWDAISIALDGKLALALGMENGSPLGGDVKELDYWFDKGIRYITLAHSRSNEFSDSSYDTDERWGGLSDAGKQLVLAMNEKGVMIDISHLTDNASWQVLELSEAPVVATHSSLRHFIPDFHRNIPDDMVKAVAENGGVVMINFGSTFISNESRQWSDDYAAAYEMAVGEEQWSRDQRRSFRETYEAENPFPYATIGTVADHIDRVVQLAGINHVGFGSDYDGVGDTLPVALKNVSHFPNLIAELIHRGYNEKELEKIVGLNFLNVWAEVEKTASSRGNEVQCSY